MRRNLPKTILLAGGAAGTLDILAALSSYVPRGGSVEGVLKYIASGVLGPSALRGGTEVAWAGLLCHFALTTGMAAVFLAAALRLRTLTAQPWGWGALYGVLTWAAMVYVVVPLSAVPGWKLPEGWNIVGGLMPHIFYVGIPIALIVRRGLGEGGRAG